MLTLIATPIGNLQDISQRSRIAMEEADILACEDTRQTKKLIQLLGLSVSARLIAYHDHNGAKMRPAILSALAKGQKVGLVSDAGTPLISDPGYKLVKEVRQAGYPVTATAGASAPILALILSGLPSDRFLFHGFLPDKQKQAQSQLDECKTLSVTHLFFVSPSQLVKNLELIAACFGDRQASLVREITKLHEEVIAGNLSELADSYHTNPVPKGELVLVVGPAEKQIDYSETEITAILEQRLSELSVRDAVSEVASLTGQPRKTIYQMALALQKP
ncbi:MAG: 16S rRNA (cytidine(1402)-2'-O)-methyltransferase [Candidatus Puniceispirillaceae bacterium]